VGKPAKRWQLGVGAVILAVAVVSLATGPGGRSTWDAFAAVSDGMTEPEVAALLGGPPGAYNAGPVDFCVAMTADEFAAFDRLTKRQWVTDDALIWVGFDADGRVAKKFCTANCYGRPSWFSVLRHRLGWCERAGGGQQRQAEPGAAADGGGR
jgi:hypothetical protein